MTRLNLKTKEKRSFWEIMNKRLDQYTVGEEIAHGITHGIGTALSIAGLTLLVVLAVNRGDVRHVVAFSIYGTTLFLLYLASTLYHSLQFKALRQPLQIIDHAGIYLLIAGTYTPFLLLGIGGLNGYILLAIVWLIALIGIIFKIFYINRFVVASTASYLLMGWLGISVWNQFVAQIPPAGIRMIVAGGIFYTVGVLFYALERLPYNHVIWHLFVLGGSACHFWAMFSLL